MLYSSLISVDNLQLAWRRITAGTNVEHKRFFRGIYEAYESGLKENLRYLHERLRGGWEPSPPTRIYAPKPSGLLRPLTLLSVEDQIVFQAIANQFAKRLRKRRKAVERKQVYSNCLTRDPRSIHFFQDWHETYPLLRRKLSRYRQAGYRWVAEFDLAAFYDTISHKGLIDVVSPRGGDRDDWKRVRGWLPTWSGDERGAQLDHGIPQGPLASSFLAEAYLLPIDEEMRRAKIKYLRYVDDICILARTESEAWRAALELEQLCRRWGLIPQSSKFKVKRVSSFVEPFGYLPSMTGYEGERDEGIRFRPARAERAFRSALEGRPLRIKDKSRARYILYRAGRSAKLLRWVLRLLPLHPEHIDAFTQYLSNYRKSKRIERRVLELLRTKIPYEYVRGELWHVAARMGSRDTLKRLLGLSRRELRLKRASLALRWGVYAFQIACRRHSISTAIRGLKKESALLQALIVPVLSTRDFQRDGIVGEFLRAKSFEPAIVLGKPFVRRGLSHRTFGIKTKELSTQVQNVYRGLEIIRRTAAVRVDQIGEILEKRYAIAKWHKWRGVFGQKYHHALQILLHANGLYAPSRSEWMQSQNSFNDALTRALIPLLSRYHGLAPVKVVDRKGRLVKFGVLVDSGHPFGRAFPRIADAFRAFNDRRNHLPGSHPYDEKGGLKNRFLRDKEQTTYSKRIGIAYGEIIRLMDRHL